MEGMRSSASQSAEVAAHKALQPAADGLAARILEKKKTPHSMPVPCCRAMTRMAACRGQTTDQGALTQRRRQ